MRPPEAHTEEVFPTEPVESVPGDEAPEMRETARAGRTRREIVSHSRMVKRIQRTPFKETVFGGRSPQPLRGECAEFSDPRFIKWTYPRSVEHGGRHRRAPKPRPIRHHGGRRRPANNKDPDSDEPARGRPRGLAERDTRPRRGWR